MNWAAIAERSLAGSTRLSTCENTRSLTGAAKIPRKIRDRTTTETGRFITYLAVRAQPPSSLGASDFLRTTNLSIRLPNSASIAGSGISELKIAIETTDTPA